MSRTASCSAVSGLRPAIGSVVDLWKNSGIISTAPPMATTMRISTIIRKLLVSTFSCEKPAALGVLLMVLRPSGGLRRGDRDAHGAARRHGHPRVPGHLQHSTQVQEAADRADHVDGI